MGRYCQEKSDKWGKEEPVILSFPGTLLSSLIWEGKRSGSYTRASGLFLQLCVQYNKKLKVLWRPQRNVKEICRYWDEAKEELG